MFFAYIDPGSGYTIFSLGSWLIISLLGTLGVFLVFFKKIFRYLKGHKKIMTIILLIVITLAITIIGVIMMNEMESKFNKKVVILGFDGLSPEIIEPMMERGELPSFSRLKKKGS